MAANFKSVSLIGKFLAGLTFYFLQNQNKLVVFVFCYNLVNIMPIKIGYKAKTRIRVSIVGTSLEDLGPF